MSKADARIQALITASSIGFIIVLAVSAVFDPTIRLLHARKPRKTRADLGRFLAGGLLATAWLVAIIFVTGRQYIPLMRRVFGIE